MLEPCTPILFWQIVSNLRQWSTKQPALLVISTSRAHYAKDKWSGHGVENIVIPMCLAVKKDVSLLFYLSACVQKWVSKDPAAVGDGKVSSWISKRTYSSISSAQQGRKSFVRKEEAGGLLQESLQESSRNKDRSSHANCLSEGKRFLRGHCTSISWSKIWVQST